MREFNALKNLAANPLQESSAMMAIKRMRETIAFTSAIDIGNSSALAAVRAMQNTIDLVQPPTSGILAAFEEYRRIVEPITNSLQAFNDIYAPILEQRRIFDNMHMKGIISGVQYSASAMSAIAHINLSGIANIIATLPKYEFFADIKTCGSAFEEAEKLYERGEITQEDINEEIVEIVSTRQFSPKAEWDKIKKSKWCIALKVVLPILLFFCRPVLDYAGDKILDTLQVTQLWESSGIYELIDTVFANFESEEATGNEDVKEREKVDIKENTIQALNHRILAILLKDKTTRKNIVWGTDNYTEHGEGYRNDDFITVEAITGENGNVIKPRTEKSKEEQSQRSKEKAEVFTPSWVCNKQNNLVDEAWFEYENVFNTETDNGWITNTNKIVFPNIKKKTWQDYVKANRLEISCGEAPYLASRYDAVTGEYIPVKERIGLLDRKLRVVSENTDSEPDWVFWATKAVKSVYGFDWQGDNVLLARENIVFTFAEHYEDKFGVPAIPEYLIKISKVVAWNIWQMDGIKFVVPDSCHKEEDKQITFLGDGPIMHECPGCEKDDHSKHNGIYCRIYDWSANRSVEFYSFIKKGARNNGKI